MIDDRLAGRARVVCRGRGLLHHGSRVFARRVVSSHLLLARLTSAYRLQSWVLLVVSGCSCAFHAVPSLVWHLANQVMSFLSSSNLLVGLPCFR